MIARTPAVASLAQETLRALACGGARPRLIMRGASMEPLLAEGMILELRRFERSKARVGEIVVFVEGERLVAHRIVARPTGDRLRTCGDARPAAPEWVPLEKVIGTLDAVYASDAADATRIDDERFDRRGRALARGRSARAFIARARAVGVRLSGALPWNREPLFDVLVEIVAADIAGDAERIARAIERVDTLRLIWFAQRHGCRILLHRALESVASDRARGLRARLQTIARSGAVRAVAHRMQVVAIVRLLNDAHVPFALLKGAARSYRDDPDARVYVSHDIDIIVPDDAIDAAVAAFQHAAYAFRASARERRWYVRGSHHLAALFPPGRGWPVEIHRRLERSKWLSTPTDWNALASHLTRVDGEAGPAFVLDRYATTLHHAVHGVGFGRLRDIAVVAASLRRLAPCERDDLAAVVRDERRDPIRLRAFFELAARVAGLDAYASDDRTRAYVAWAAVRESMPPKIGRRARVLEAWFAGGGTPRGLRARFLEAGPWNPLKQLTMVALVPITIVYLRAIKR